MKKTISAKMIKISKSFLCKDKHCIIVVLVPSFHASAISSSVFLVFCLHFSGSIFFWTGVININCAVMTVEWIYPFIPICPFMFSEPLLVEKKSDCWSLFVVASISLFAFSFRVDQLVTRKNLFGTLRLLTLEGNKVERPFPQKPRGFSTTIPQMELTSGAQNWR